MEKQTIRKANTEVLYQTGDGHEYFEAIIGEPSEVEIILAQENNTINIHLDNIEELIRSLRRVKKYCK